MTKNTINQVLEKSKRQLVAIMFTDIVGYTAMMQLDEAKAMTCLNKFKKELEVSVPDFNGEIIQFYGDGCLAIFNNALDAVHSAIDLQKSFQIEPEVLVRIGIHLGDVVFKEGNIFGDNVNIASRIESIGIAGSILLSKNIRNQIKNKPEFQLTSLGDFEFKNVNEPMEVYALANEGLAVPRKSEMDGKLKEVEKSDQVEKSIAVLAFENRSGDPEQEYFSDGVSEEIIYALSKLENLKVAGRASSFSFKGKNLDLQEIGHKLNVNNLLEGSIRKMGNRVRITAQLVNAGNGFQIWTERFDRELKDIFAIQDDIAQTIAEKLELTLLSDIKKEPLVIPKTKNIGAYQLYLKGRHYLDQRAHIDTAASHFRKALELDNEYALAYSGLGYSYFYQVYFNNKPPSNLLKAREAAKLAMSLDPTIAEPHLIEGIVTFYYDRNPQGALAHYEKAIELNPQDSDIYRVKAYYHSMIGELSEAVILAKKAAKIDPLNLNIQLSLGEILYRCNQFENAIEVLENLVKSYPDSKITWLLLGHSYYFIDEVEKFEKIISRQKIIEDSNISFYLFSSYSLLAEIGHIDEVQQFLKTIEEDNSGRWISPVSIAGLYLNLGDDKQAKQYFQKALVEKDPVLMVINIEPTWKKYRNHPEVQSVLKEVGIIQ